MPKLQAMSSVCRGSDGRHPLRQVSGKYLFTPVAAEMLLEWAKAALDDVPLKFSISLKDVVAEWIHFTLFEIIVPTIKLKVYTFWGL